MNMNHYLALICATGMILVASSLFDLILGAVAAIVCWLTGELIRERDS